MEKNGELLSGDRKIEFDDFIGNGGCGDDSWSVEWKSCEFSEFYNALIDV